MAGVNYLAQKHASANHTIKWANPNVIANPKGILLFRGLKHV